MSWTDEVVAGGLVALLVAGLFVALLMALALLVVLVDRFGEPDGGQRLRRRRRRVHR